MEDCDHNGEDGSLPLSVLQQVCLDPTVSQNFPFYRQFAASLLLMPHMSSGTWAGDQFRKHLCDFFKAPPQVSPLCPSLSSPPGTSSSLLYIHICGSIPSVLQTRSKACLISVQAEMVPPAHSPHYPPTYTHACIPTCLLVGLMNGLTFEER